MQTEPRLMDVLSLAFVGDAVYEIFIRERIVRSSGIAGADKLHKAAVAYVCAGAQAKAVKRLMESGALAEDEEALTRRAHNHKIATKPKNATPVDYKWATAFEALLGYLKLSEKNERLSEIMEKAAEISEEK